MDKKKKILIGTGILVGTLLLLLLVQFLAFKGITLFKDKSEVKEVKKTDITDGEAKKTETDLSFLDKVDENYAFLMEQATDKFEASKLDGRQKFCWATIRLAGDITTRTVGKTQYATYSYDLKELNRILANSFGDKVTLAPENIGKSKLPLSACTDADTITYNKDKKTLQYTNSYAVSDEYDGDYEDSYGEVYSKKKWTKIEQTDDQIAIYATAFFVQNTIDDAKINAEIEKLSGSTDEYPYGSFVFGKFRAYKDGERKQLIAEKDMDTYLFKDKTYYNVIEEQKYYEPQISEYNEYMNLSYTYKFTFDNTDNRNFISYERIK